jgi:hypothetical protein
MAVLAALATAGFDSVECRGTNCFTANRKFLPGVMVGQGKEEVVVRIIQQPSGKLTIDVESRKPYPYFFAPSHMDRRICHYIETYLKANSRPGDKNITTGTQADSDT